MAKIAKLSATWSGLLPVLDRVIRDWQPESANRELAYRNSLVDYLRARLPEDAVVEKEYRNRGTTIDIWIKWAGLFVEDEVAVELKFNLTKKTECDRLVGQVEQLDPKKHKTIVILIGKTEEQFANRIAKKYADQIKPPIGIPPTMLFICLTEFAGATQLGKLG